MRGQLGAHAARSAASAAAAAGDGEVPSAGVCPRAPDGTTAAIAAIRRPARRWLPTSDTSAAPPTCLSRTDGAQVRVGPA
jgi:hypothetical protein